MNCFQYMCSTQSYIENDILSSLTLLVKDLESHNEDKVKIDKCIVQCKKYIKSKKAKYILHRKSD